MTSKIKTNEPAYEHENVYLSEIYIEFLMDNYISIVELDELALGNDNVSFTRKLKCFWGK